ncbi:hypothetical protein U8527_09190 [Kordia algicida OT-1]|uniref:Uncharacterized protein n=1 Tax=Kordia algicida OT-1 TaxID=391587 RepID=A9DUD0_9FLAO|nr:hypothetical protein [Kordia algicida]EDP96275.1 hypothetical protein KAOT1_02662 [Kordia algicida OT-1]
MKKVIGLFLIFVMFALLSFSTQNNCRKYFKGKWKYEKYDAEYIYVVREEKVQRAYMENGKYYYEFSINWLSDCSYELTYVGTNSPNPAVAKIGEKFSVEITNINDSITEYKTIFREKTDVGRMVRMK